jgi:hypothetical protein
MRVIREESPTTTIYGLTDLEVQLLQFLVAELTDNQPLGNLFDGLSRILKTAGLDPGWRAWERDAAGDLKKREE